MGQVLHEIAEEILQSTAALIERVAGAGAVANEEDQIKFAQADAQLEIDVLRPPLREVQRLRQIAVDLFNDAVGVPLLILIERFLQFREDRTVDPGNLQQEPCGEG